MSYQISAACGCVTGKVRAKNEDDLYFNDRPFDKTSAADAILSCKCYSDAFPVFAVFDGMGGESNGELASSLARDELARCAKVSPRDENLLLGAARAANERVCKQMNKMNSGRMGATAAMLHFSKDTVRFCNIGDSRIYHYCGEKLEQLSVDHIEASPNGAHKGGLTQHIGIYEHEMVIEPFSDTRAASVGDRYLICSDGLTDMLNDSEIAGVLHENKEPQQAADALIKAAMERGGKDNITVIVCDIVKKVLMRMDHLICLAALIVAAVIGGFLYWDSTIPVSAALLGEDAAIAILEGESQSFAYLVDPPRKTGSVAVVIENEKIARIEPGKVYALSAGTTKIVITDRSGKVLDEREVTVYAK